ncbi:LCP family protein [Nocardia brevicatena]|uniref:LCP family protein n=1 Tax=Nocardia brevicatena TaxID=37327 RepID=UPI0005933212|nr:LCP family protein [Nocardia brevicatena]
MPPAQPPLAPERPDSPAGDSPSTTAARRSVPGPTGAGPAAPAARRPAPTPARAEAPHEPDTESQSSSQAARQPNSTPPAGPAGRKPTAAAATEIAPAVRDAAPVVQDIAASSPAGADEAVQPEEVTDVLSPVDEDAPRIVGRTNTSGWPTAEPLSSPEPADRKRRSRTGDEPPRYRRLRMAGRGVVAFLAALALLITGGAWSYLQATNNSFTQVSALDENTENVIDANAQLGDENYLLVGTDTRAGANGELGAGTIEDAEGARADTTMLVHIPENRQRVVVVSFPRDLDVTRPECARWDNEKPGYLDEIYPSAMGDKLNAVYALGGPKCLVSTIQKLTGSTINHFIGIDFAGFETMVDKIGGVEVCASRPVIDGVLGPILEEPGRHRISGPTALNYVRARHVYGEERSDYDRIARQQRFLASLLRGSLSSRVLFDPGKLNGFVSAFRNTTFVDKVTTDDLLTLGRSLQGLDAGAVTFLTIPTAGTTSYGNEIPRESDIKAIFRAIRDDQPLPGEKPPPAGANTAPAAPPPAPEYTAVDPGIVSLLVSNGSGITGAARTAATELGNAGFTIYNTDNYSEGNSPETKVRYSTGHEAEAATVASSIPGVTMEVDETLGGIVEVVLGTNYQGVVNEPTPVGDPITEIPATSSAPAELPSDLEHVNAADDPCA